RRTIHTEPAAKLPAASVGGIPAASPAPTTTLCREAILPFRIDANPPHTPRAPDARVLPCPGPHSGGANPQDQCRSRFPGHPASRSLARSNEPVSLPDQIGSARRRHRAVL